MILGPTAGGKSALAVALAERIPDGGEVVGADAFQVYRHLDAGTAKPDMGLRSRVAHHLIDIVEPTQRFTVFDWLELATRVIVDIQQRGRTPIIVGGTNLYLKALIDGMFDGPGQDAAFRASLQGIATAELHQRLQQVDPESADRIKPADRQRIVRALEVYETTGTPISQLQTQWRVDLSTPTPNPQHPKPILIGLRWSPEAINPRINLRVKAMFYPDKVEPELAAAVCINGESLIDEVKRLKVRGAFDPIGLELQPPTPNPQNPTAPNQAREALGYKQVLAWLEGTDPHIATLDEAYEKTKVLTRRFAKQQRTWLKRFVQTCWIACDTQGPEAVAEEALGHALLTH